MSSMGKFEFKVTPNRGRDGEAIHLWMTVKPKGLDAYSANFWLSRDEAYDLAHQLQHEADWLKSLRPELAESDRTEEA